MATTFGNPGAPSQETRNFDSLFSHSLSNYRKTFVDQISTSNAFFTKLKESGSYRGENGGTDIKVPLMYALGNPDWFDGYDELHTAPMDGHTQAIYEWRECSVPITISRKEERQNAQKIAPLLKSKIMQAEMGMKEFMGKALLQGSLANGGASVETEQTSARNGASGIHTLANHIQLDPTTSETIGNINQSTSSWWRNNTSSSTATDYEGLLAEMQTVYNNCAKGPGGSPDMLLMNQTTFEIIIRALWNRGGSRATDAAQVNFPFENIKFLRAMAVWDEFMPDIENDSLTITTGTIYFLNTKFFELVYDSQTNFVNTPFTSAQNQPNARTAHILWMGNLVSSNRRKQGVLYGINQTMSS